MTPLLYPVLLTQLKTTGFDCVSYVPQSANPASGAAFPYVVLEAPKLNELDSDEMLFWEGTFLVHVWSRTKSVKQVIEMQSAIFTAMHRFTATMTGYALVDCIQEFSEQLADPDGNTRHGIQRFHVNIGKS